MQWFKNTLMLLAVVLLLSCNDSISTSSNSESSLNQVRLELKQNTKTGINNFSNSPFFDGIKLIEITNDKMVVEIDTAIIDIATAKESLMRQGLKVNRQYQISKTVSTHQGRNDRKPVTSLKIPEITFPNIFKALVVFYN